MQVPLLQTTSCRPRMKLKGKNANPMPRFRPRQGFCSGMERRSFVANQSRCGNDPQGSEKSAAAFVFRGDRDNLEPWQRTSTLNMIGMMEAAGYNALETFCEGDK